jgi:hypothetical protein
MSKVTLDTNLLLEYWKKQEKHEIVEQLITRAKNGEFELAITSRVRQDIPDPPLASEIDELPKLSIQETSSVTRIGYWQIGIDSLGDEDFVDFTTKVNELSATKGGRIPDWRDWDHLHAHYLQGRDIFLTWDRGILQIAEGLNLEFGIVVMTPDQFIESLQLI